MGSKYKPSKEQQELLARQSEELKASREKESQQRAALERRRRGRASLISNDERGVTSKLG